MRRIFTEDYLASISGVPAPFEGSRIKRIALSNDAPFRGRREALESKIAAYPEAQQAELIGRIQSFSDEESQAAQAELDVHELLRREFNPVQVEPALAIVGGKTPDFWVEGQAAFEVASTFAHENSVVRDLIKALNAAPSEVKVFGIKVYNVPDDRFPKISVLRNLVLAQMEAYSWGACDEPVPRADASGAGSYRVSLPGRPGTRNSRGYP